MHFTAKGKPEVNMFTFMKAIIAGTGLPNGHQDQIEAYFAVGDEIYKSAYRLVLQTNEKVQVTSLLTNSTMTINNDSIMEEDEYDHIANAFKTLRSIAVDGEWITKEQAREISG